MKRLLGLFFVLSALNTQAQESNLNITTDEGATTRTQSPSKSEFQFEEETSWRFRLGQSTYESNSNQSFSEKGSGLTLGASYDFTDFISAGGTFTNFKNTNSGNMETTAAFAELTPIRYQIKSVEIAGSLMLGLIHSNFPDYSTSDTSLFYGGALTMNLSKAVGLTINTKVSREFRAMNEISLIGYY